MKFSTKNRLILNDALVNKSQLISKSLKKDGGCP